ncbi:MAG: hypothetical protein J7642_03600 [Cyanobacteria bacterium SBC]|nr:hypothetical protein [Cyanobacteria bacterium SBC]
MRRVPRKSTVTEILQFQCFYWFDKARSCVCASTIADDNAFDRAVNRPQSSELMLDIASFRDIECFIALRSTLVYLDRHSRKIYG